MKRTILIILDGFGIRTETDRNAVAAADAPTLKRLISQHSQTRLATCGHDVGLPDGIMGNSEVGHLNIGAGRIVYQDITRIDQALDDGTFIRSSEYLSMVADARREGTSLHLMGLVSDGGVHSSLDHVKKLLTVLTAAGVRRIFLHAFTDGRDTPPKSGLHYVHDLQQHAESLGLPGVVSVIGRYYAMDRDKRWDRVEKAYRCLVHGEGLAFPTPEAALEDSYSRDVTDEFVLPGYIQREGEAQGRIKPGDTILFFNFRADRGREISRALAIPGFTEFATVPLDLKYYTLTQYDATFPFPVLSHPQTMSGLLAETFSKHGLKQLRCAETEKYAHVTYFFNGGVEQPFEGEERVLIPSPKVATYDLQPEMSSVEVTRNVVEQIVSGKFDNIVVNFANCDMVGHTGVLSAATAAVEAVDRGVESILNTAKQHGYDVFVTADHGNAEQMWDYHEDCPHTQHTLNDVYFIYGNDAEVRFRERGRLADIAPTLLDWMGIPQPQEMTGETLILK